MLAAATNQCVTLVPGLIAICRRTACSNCCVSTDSARTSTRSRRSSSRSCWISRAQGPKLLQMRAHFGREPGIQLPGKIEWRQWADIITIDRACAFPVSGANRSRSDCLARLNRDITSPTGAFRISAISRQVNPSTTPSISTVRCSSANPRSAPSISRASSSAGRMAPCI
jgi:hypothetical protein